MEKISNEMAATFSQSRDRVIFKGRGIKFLHFKASVTTAVGADLVVSEGMGIFSVSRDALPSIFDVLTEFTIDITALHGDVAWADTHVLARAKALEIIKKDDVTGLSDAWKSKLKNYQSAAVNAMIVPGLAGLCLFDEQGTGKTVMSIAAFDLLIKREEIDNALVICPKSVINSWEKDFDTFASEYSVKVVSGTGREKNATIRGADDVYLLNYETIPSLLVTLKALAKSKKSLLIVDESFYVKNMDATRSKCLRELRDCCTRAFVLCGTPAPNDSVDLVGQFNVADRGYTFRGFTTTGNRLDDAEHIRQAINERGVYLRRLKSQVLPDLPTKKFNVIEVEITGSQAQLYNKAKNELTLYLRSIDNQILKKNLTTYFSKRSVLLQICSFPKGQDPLFTGTHAKLKELDILLDRLIQQEGKKVVVWSFYKLSLSEISSRYKKYGVVKIDGGTSSSERKEAINKFQNNPKIKLFVGNPAAAGAGITLHAASDSIFVSLSDQAAQFLQALDRTHRIGQKANAVCYHILVCKGTIEKNQIKILREKEMIQHQLLHARGDFPSTLEDALAELGESESE